MSDADTTSTSPEESSAPDRTTPLARHSHRLGPLIMLVLSVAFLIASLGLPLGVLDRPGPGLWPSAVAALTGLLSLIACFIPARDEELFARTPLLRVSGLMIALVAFPYLLEPAGFLIPAALLVIFMMRFLSHSPWVKSIVVAVSTAAGAYVVFGVLLGVRLTALPL